MQRRFPRAHRLTKPAEFRFVFAENQRAGDRYCTLLARPSGLPQARLGLAIAKRRVRLGVDRNRIKRLIRESFRHNQHLVEGLDIVAMARDGAGSADPKELRASLDRQWQRLAKRCANWPPA